MSPSISKPFPFHGRFGRDSGEPTCCDAPPAGPLTRRHLCFLALVTERAKPPVLLILQGGFCCSTVFRSSLSVSLKWVGCPESGPWLGLVFQASVTGADATFCHVPCDAQLSPRHGWFIV